MVIGLYLFDKKPDSLYPPLLVYLVWLYPFGLSSPIFSEKPELQTLIKQQATKLFKSEFWSRQFLNKQLECG
jgi:hypothetical protein